MSRDIAILGAGMHPWGKWGRNFVEYGVAAIREALADADVDYRDIGFVAGAASSVVNQPSTAGMRVVSILLVVSTLLRLRSRYASPARRRSEGRR